MKSYQVETGDKAISDALLKIAAENGWNYFPSSSRHLPWLLLFPTLRRGGWNIGSFDKHQTVTIPEFIKLLKKEPLPPPIMIGRHEVEFRKTQGFISVGGECVSIAKVDAIHARLHADDEDSESE